MTKLIVTRYTVFSSIEKQIKIAMLADLHNQSSTAVLGILEHEHPDVIVMCGDILTVPYMECANSINLFHHAAKLAPIFYSLGNHEDNLQLNDLEYLESLDNFKILNNTWCKLGGMAIGGLTPEYAESASFYDSYFVAPQAPNMAWIDDFCKECGFKILLCHNPEYYPLYLKDKNINLILAGHTHGGVIRIKGRGLFAPGQGFFPSYVYGMYDDKFIVSSGLSKKTGCLIPRIFNPPEVVIIQLQPKHD